MSLPRTTTIETQDPSSLMRTDMDEDGTIVITPGGDGPVDASQLREAAAAALAEHADAGLRVDLGEAGRLDGPVLAVIAQCWLAVSERERELVVVPGDPTDRPVLERLGFDEFYRVADAV